MAPLALSCGAPTRVPLPPPTSAVPGPATVVQSPGTASAQPGTPDTYTGHGADTVPPELLEKYRPRPLRPELAARIEALIDVRAPGIGRLSPDGKALYFSWTVTGIGQIWKIDGPGRFPQQLTGGEDNTALAGITPDGRTLVIERDRKGEENPGLYLQPAGGGPLEPIQHVRGVQTLFEAISSDSRFVYFTANDRKPDAYVVYRYDLAHHRKEVAFDREEGLWHVSDVRDDGRLLLRKETGSLTAEYYEWDPAKATLAPLLGVGENEEYDARYGAHDGELVVLTNKLGEYRRLYAFRGGEFHPIGDDVKFDVETFEVDRRRTRVLYATNESGYSRPHAVDAKTFRPIALPPLPPGVDQVTLGATTPDGRFTTMGVDDGRHPLQGYVVDWSRGTLTAWHQPSAPEVDTTHFARAALET
ncbi:MAG: S9 family peptidase, partial [Polyangiaceae bacterium]|nr:S9 family peptidase [Polyangiaceae bacterium]